MRYIYALKDPRDNQTRYIGKDAIKAQWDEKRKQGIRKPGPVHTAETKVRLSAAHTGKTLSLEHRKKLALAKLFKSWSVKRQIKTLNKKGDR